MHVHCGVHTREGGEREREKKGRRKEENSLPFGVQWEAEGVEEVQAMALHPSGFPEAEAMIP